MSEQTPQYIIAVVARTLDVLEALAAAETSLGATDLARLPGTGRGADRRGVVEGGVPAGDTAGDSNCALKRICTQRVCPEDSPITPGVSTVNIWVARLRRDAASPLCEAVEACVAAGVGETVTLAVGGKTDSMHGRPVTVIGRVRTISEGKWEDTRPTHGGYRFYDAGKTAVLETTDGHTLVLHARRLGNYSIGEMYSVGIFPEEYHVVVAKGVQSPRPAYQPIAAEVIMVNTPGVSTADLESFPYTRRRHPLYPFEMDATYE